MKYKRRKSKKTSWPFWMCIDISVNVRTQVLSLFVKVPNARSSIIFILHVEPECLACEMTFLLSKWFKDLIYCSSDDCNSRWAHRLSTLLLCDSSPSKMEEGDMYFLVCNPVCYNDRLCTVFFNNIKARCASSSRNTSTAFCRIVFKITNQRALEMHVT